MRLLVVLTCAAVVAALAGCGGGGGGGAITPTVFFDDSNCTEKSSEVISVAYRTAAQLPLEPEGDAFVAGAEVRPGEATFDPAATLTFRLATAVPAGKQVGLFQLVESEELDNWTHIENSVVTLSQDRLTATVEVSVFPTSGYLAILELPTP